MIELSQIQNTSKLKELRGQINTMVDEINGNQMVVGQVLNPIVKIVDIKFNTIVNVSVVINQLFALCMLESNSVYVAQVFGSINGEATIDDTTAITDFINDFGAVSITIPSVKLPNSTAEVSSFVTPGSLGFTEVGIDSNSIINTGAQVTLKVSNSTDYSYLDTNPTLDGNPNDMTLTDQMLKVTPEKGQIVLLLT